MYKAYIINYDLNSPGQNYDAVIEAIKTLGPWWHFLKSCWIVVSPLTADQIWDSISSKFDRGDHALVVEIRGGNKQGWLPKEAWDWLNSKIAA